MDQIDEDDMVTISGGKYDGITGEVASKTANTFTIWLDKNNNKKSGNLKPDRVKELVKEIQSQSAPVSQTVPAVDQDQTDDEDNEADEPWYKRGFGAASNMLNSVRNTTGYPSEKGFNVYVTDENFFFFVQKKNGQFVRRISPKTGKIVKQSLN